MGVERKRLRSYFLGAAALSLVLHLIQPWGRYALYPFALLSTWAHEMGHGLAALLLGGRFDHLELRPDLGGTAYHSIGGLARPLVAMAGLLGPALAGGAIIALGSRSERTARRALLGLAVVALLSTVVWVRPLVSFGFVAMLVVGGLLLGAALSKKPALELFLVQLVGIQLCLGSLADFDYMFSAGFVREGQPMQSDTATMAEHWLLPYWVWGALVAGLSLLILAGAFWVAWIRPERRSRA